MHLRRLFLAAAVLAAPAVVGAADSAQASCYPQKPQTCPIECPSGWERVTTPTGGQACLPELDRAEPPIQ